MGASAIARAAALALHSGMYLDRIPGGIEGDLRMRAELRTDILEATPENIARNRLTTEEIDDYLAYSGWNLWDLLAARQTEGENSLIPRQEYECTGFLQCWLQYPRFFEAITAELGVDGLVDLWATGRREPGSKINQAHAWAIGQMPLIGRGLAVALGIQRADERLDELNTVVQFARRTMHGAVGPGPIFLSARGYRSPSLDDTWIDRFVADHEPLDDPERTKAFRQLIAQSELFGFLLHFDARSALNDTGPYELPDGRVVIVRDHFLTAPNYHWAGVSEGLPHCVTQAMFFGPSDELRLTVNDLGDHVRGPQELPPVPDRGRRLRARHDRHAGVRAAPAVRRRAGRDHPRDPAAHDEDVRPDRGDDAPRSDHERRAELHRRADRAAGPAPPACGRRSATEMQFDELHPLTSDAYYTFARGAAVELLPPVFTEGAAFPAGRAARDLVTASARRCRARRSCRRT